jgi:hypothetical protein
MKLLKLNTIKLFGLYLLSIMVRYYLPQAAGDIFFLILLLIFYNSKDNTFWLAFILLLVQSPGYLFAAHSPNFALPSIWVTSKVEILYPSFFFLIAFIKAIMAKRYNLKQFYGRDITYLAVYLIFMIILSSIFDFKVTRMFGIILLTMPLLSFYFIPRLITTEIQYANLFSILFTFAIILFIAQISDLLGFRPLAAYLGETFFGRSSSGKLLDENVAYLFTEKYGRASIYGVHISFMSFMMALYYFVSNNSYFNKYYLIAIISITTLSFTLTGTRGWMIAFLVMIILFIFSIANRPRILFKFVFVPLIMIALSLSTSAKVRNLASSGLDRLETVGLVLRGDITAGGTLGRLDVRGPRVLEMFYKSPIIGWGFTENYRNYSDKHVGQHNMLLNGGIVGYVLFMYFFTHYIYKLFSVYRYSSVQNIYRQGIFIFIIGFIGMFIIHSSTTMMFGYDMQFAKSLMLAVFISFSDYNYRQVIKYDQNI